MKINNIRCVLYNLNIGFLLFETHSFFLRDSKSTWFIHLNGLFFRCVQDFKHIDANWILVKASFLEHFFDDCKFSKVEFSFFIKNIVVSLKLLDLVLKGLDFLFIPGASASSETLHWGWVLSGACIWWGICCRFTLINFASCFRLLLLTASATTRCSNFVASHDVEKILTFSTLKSTVGLPRVIKVKVSFDPLTKLKIVLIPGLYEFVHIDMSFNSILVEGLLKDFVVFYVFIIKFGSPFDFS